ncbi:Protein O-GlcNAcase isoform X2 [Oopsacas minuta]|uniref:protein O-GlcNAcase n=1 Tax=Oopsacas minuta TaxID=111878 RepID=A0AAV7JF19_9METZ|nr:Protein O-GlcNAcase isoform X2 [Oopsacas minuta]
MADQISHQFLGGVVEGFYGIPWTKEERICLFQRMYHWHLQYYMYAPKDDTKHRADWREPYTQLELDNFKDLRIAANNNNVDFIYAISPGLNISFSKLTDRKSLLDKFQQLQSVGIKSFAILFDDIESNLSKDDSLKFSSPAEAQADLTNEIYQQTGEPKVFLFCPTEYCGSHIGPELNGSVYLNVIGEKLHSNIRVMWTGNRVISNRISTKSIKKLIKVIRRRPVIWDNLHANDYDQRRLYLGPYTGRSTRLLAHLSGILSNPNNEFEMNYVPLYTLGAYCSYYQKVYEASLQADSMEIDTSPVDLSSLGLKDTEIGTPPGDLDLKDTIIPVTAKTADIMKADTPQDMEVISVDESKSSIIYEPRKVMVTALSDWIPYFYESPLTAGLNTMDTELATSSGEVEMECERVLKPVSEKYRKYEGKLSVEDLSLLCDLFYLPGEHGPAAEDLLQEAVWLKEYGYKMHQSHHTDTEDKELGMDKIWLERVENFHRISERVVQLAIRLVQIPNRELFRQIHPYLWDCKEAVLLFDSFLKWLAQAKDDLKSSSYLPKDPSCLSGGGLTGDIQRLLPHVEHSTELYSYKNIPHSCMEIITIRPYQEGDKSSLFSVCLKSEQNETESFQTFPDIITDIRVNSYLEFSPNLCFVAEDNWGVCGYIMATSDSTEFYTFLMETWLPRIRKKYPCPNDDTELNSESQLLGSLHQTKIDMTSSILKDFPSHFHVELTTRDRGKSILTRMVRCIISVLKAKGSKGIHVDVNEEKFELFEFYLNIGFKKLDKSDQLNKSRIGYATLGRWL